MLSYTHASAIRAGRDGGPIRQVFRYRYDPLGRRIAKEDDFGQTRFVWEGLRLLQESRGAQTSTYVYEPASYRPLARIDGAGLLEPEHPVAVLALAGEDPRGDPAMGKVRSIPVTNGDASDAHHAVAGPVGATARYLAELGAQRKGAVETSASVRMPEPDLAQQTASASVPSARIYYFHLQPNGLPDEMSDRNGQVVWRAQYRVWGSAVAEGWQAFDAAGRPVDTSMAEMGIQTQAGASPMPQNLRMQGQYLDRETGLHYNTFRYYDADLGAFTTPDPIGLAGGMNLHRYASNPLAWIDPLGWVCGEGGHFSGTERPRSSGGPLRIIFIPKQIGQEKLLFRTPFTIQMVLQLARLILKTMAEALCLGMVICLIRPVIFLPPMDLERLT
ncbi:RHS repeat-associated core domain-containing protein [Paracidovorax oryzae]|uniref:RHS repeat-associated core domain-containing protein n=1 Tax=Paracidovorax oryzae TaxID=862720 RepID=UPI0035CEE959